MSKLYDRQTDKLQLKLTSSIERMSSKKTLIRNEYQDAVKSFLRKQERRQKKKKSSLKLQMTVINNGVDQISPLEKSAEKMQVSEQ